MRRLSWYHITTRSAFLAIALILALALWYLPHFLELDEFRPPVIDLLQKAFHCHVIVGNIRGELVPYPGLVVGHVVFAKEGKAPRVLASVNGVHLWFSIKILEGHLRFREVRFNRPRFILHREAGSSDEKSWTMLSLPDNRGGSNLPVDEWQIRNGRIEYWDHTTRPTFKWVADQFNGSFLTSSQSGSMTGKIPRLGRRATLELRYTGSAAFPIETHLGAVELGALRKGMRLQIPALDGTVDFLVKARFHPDLSIQAILAPVFLARAHGERFRAHASFEKNHLHVYLQTLATEPMTVTVDSDFAKAAWKARAIVSGYDAALVKNFYDQSWVDRLEGLGSIDAQAQSSPGGWSWSATGKGFRLQDTAFSLPEWSAQGDARHLSVVVHGITSQGGITEVTWALPAGSYDASLSVEASSLTLRQVLEVFNLQSKPESASAAKPEGAMNNPYGYEPWPISQGSLRGIIHDGTAFEILPSRFVIAGMPVNLSGTFELTPIHPQARIQGEVQHIAVSSAVESFFKPSSPITGAGRLNFSLAFPMSDRWINGLSGSLQMEIDNGLVRELKTIYRIMSVLNLGNYLRLRFPQITARGIQFQTLIGHLTFQNGVLSSEDLFLKGPNMNVGAKGSLDIPGQRIKLTLRLEMFRFLEDILRDVPITHWIFKKPSKILLPLVVAVEGPWDHVEIR